MAVWPSGRSAEIIEPFFISIIKILKYYNINNITNSSQFARKYVVDIGRHRPKLISATQPLGLVDTSPF